MRGRRHSLIDAVTFGLAGKAAGFIVPLAVAARYGISGDTDALYLAMAVTQLLVAVFAQGLEQYLIPFFVHAPDPATARRRLRWATLRGTIAAAAGWVLGAPLVWLLATRTASHVGVALPLTIYLVLAPQIIAAAIGACRSSCLMSRGDFRWPAASVGLRAVGVLTAMLVAPTGAGIVPLAIGFSAGEWLRVALLDLLLRRHLRAEMPSVGIDIIPPGTIRRGLWQLSSVALLGVAPLIERSLAALVAPGGVTTLEYASKLFYVFATIFDTNFVAVFVRSWAEAVREKRWLALAGDVRRWLVLIASGAAAIAIVVILGREPIVHAALARGRFSADDTRAVAPLFGVLMLAYPLAAAGMLLGGLTVALHQTRTLFEVNAIKMVVRSAAALILGWAFGLIGIVAAFALTHLVECAYLGTASRKTLRRLQRTTPAIPR